MANALTDLAKDLLRKQIELKDQIRLLMRQHAQVGAQVSQIFRDVDLSDDDELLDLVLKAEL